MTPDQERELGRLMTSAQEGDRQAYEESLTRVAALVHAFVRRRSAMSSGRRTSFKRRSSPSTAPGIPTMSPGRLPPGCMRLCKTVWWTRSAPSDEATGDSARPDRRTSARAPQERDALRADVRRAGGLPERQRQVIELLKFGSERVRDVAARLGMSEANVKVTAHRGYRALRRQIEEWTRAD